MPLDNSKLKKVYATLQQGGYKQDYNTFLKGFTGNDHYENRKKVYDLLSANGAQIGDSYEEFMKKMQVAPAPAKSTTPTAPAKPTPAKPKETPLTEADRQKMLANVGNMMAETNASIQRTQNRMDYARANAGLRVPRVTIGDKNSGVRLGQNSKVVAKKPQYNPKSGKMEQTYITESGNEFTDRGAADLEQNTIDAYKDSMSVSGQLRDAYAERDRLDEAMKKRMKEIDERPNQRFNDFMRESAAAMTPGAGPAGELEARMSKYDNDDEYLQLMAAARKNHQTIQLLEDKKNNQMNSFWHSLGTTALNGYTFTDGMSEMRDATALTRASKHIDSINRKRAAGKPLTREEQTAEAVLKNFATDNAVQGMYGGDYGAWARAGGMTANSLDFMKDLMLNPGAGSMAKGIMRGTAKGMAKGLAKVTGKEAAQLWKNNVVRRTLKATGVLIGAHMAGAYVSNTTGIGRTAATMGTLASGKVGVDDNGNYTVENAMGLLPAFAEAERQQARENGSEMFGEFIPGVGGMVKKGLEKIGLSKLSGAMTNIGNKEWYKQYSRLLKSGGYNGLPGEALEEYEGSLFDALTGHAGDAWDDMTNLQNHVDIWLGCATMGALLGSVPMMMQGHHTAQYYRYKHNTDKADNLASFRMTAERWAPLRDKIDNTDNSKMADVVTGIINNPDLHPEEKKAALNYVRNLTMMRGYNIAQVNNASDDEEQRPEVQSVNDNYSKGYDTTEPQAMNDAKNLLDMKREQVAKEHGIENVDEVDALIGDDPLRYIEEQKQLGNTDKLQSVIDYANAKSAYDGMVQRVQDDIDSRIEETNATVDSRVNRRDGMIHPASLKLKNEDGTDKKVYIVSGNVVMFDDGKGVDRKKSDNTIVIRDVETGEMKVIPPDLIRGLDAAVDPEEEKARAREAIIEEMSQTAANNVDGVVSFNEGDTYTLTDENGEQTQVTLVANEQGLVDNGDGTVNVTVDGQNVVPMNMEDIQGGVDATNMARTVQAEQERQANGENVPNSDESVQNNGENVQETPDGVEYGVNDTFTFIDGEGATIHGEVQGISDDGVEIRTDEPLNGKRVQVIPAEEFENNVESINDADGNQVWAREYVEDAAATEEVSDSTEPLDHDLVAPATPTTEELVQMARGGNELAQHQLEAQGVQWKEAIEQQTALSRVPINEETGEPMFEKADRETALDALNEITGGNDENTTAIVRAQVEQATKALEALKKKEPTKKAPSLKGSPMAMVKAQQEAEANYNTAMEEYNAQVAAAEENLNAWSRINSLMNDRKRAIREQQEAERKVREEKLHAEAVARLEEDKRIAAEKAAEQAEVGTHAVNPKIKAKWDGATKVEGNPNAITLADGSTIRGHYVLTEAGAATASHDVNKAYEPTEGFPVDENGESVNDRDYKRDRDAQRIVRDMADSYDSRALQTPVIVSKDGVVLSGNNRTMSGEIAAKNGTDKAYVDHLREFGAMFGFTPEQIDGMQHPRVVFVPDEELPYDARTFARFNAEQQKKQSKPEHAVKLGKIVPDNVFTSITNDISRFDRMSDYYADDKSVASAISQLLDAGVINEMQLPELRTGNALSAAGKELIENTLIGKVFQTSPDAVRQIISTPTLRQSVVMGLNEIANNRTLAKSGYDISKELAAAVDLVSRAKSDSPEIYKEGMPVSPYGRQPGLFDDEYGDSRVTDGVTLLLADLLNSGKPSDLRKVLSTYNNEAASPAAGQIDMFSGDVTSKEEVLNNVLNHFRNATPREQQALIDAAVAERKRRAEAAEPAGGDEASEQATVVAGSGAEPQQPVVASEEPVKGNEPDADALAKEAEEKLSERITDTEDEWTEPSEYGEIYKHRMFVDGKEVIKIDAPDKSKNYPGTYYEIDGKQFGDLYEVANYIDGNEQPLSAKIEAASAEVNTDPTEAQKEAGNYKKGHVQVGTFDITIEQPQGSVRKGTDADGKQWESKMNNTYGYIRGAVGVDGDHIDVFLSNDIDGWNGRKVFVVDQYNPDGSFDEHKVMLGFNDVDEAKSDYLANYETGWENGRRIDVSTVNLEDFEKWIASSKRKTKAFSEYSLVKKETVGNSFDDFVRDSGGEVIPNGVTRSNVINFAERVLEKYPSHTESYGTYNAKRTDVEIPANKLFKSGSDLFTAKNGNSIAVNDTQAKSRYELVAHKDAQGHLKSVSVIKYHDFDYNDAEPLVKSVKKDVVEINTPEEAGYSITPSTYTNKKGKTSDVSLLTFDHDLTADQERAVKEFAKERTGEGRFAPVRGWKDRESGGWMFRSEEDARKAAEMVGNEEAVADNQPMTAQELRDAVEPKKPTTKTASKKPANRVESVPMEEPIEPEKPKYEVSDEEMNGLMNNIRDILGIGDDEGDAGFKFRDPDELTAEQRQKLMSVGQRLAMAMVERGNESFGNYASMMVKALGDKVRPWLKAFYGGLEYVPGYDKYALTPYEEVKAFDVENFDKPTKDVMAQANMIVEEGKAQVAAEKANNELKATRNEQRKETEKQTAANTDAVAAEAKSVASEATALAETSSDEQALIGAAERVDETLDKVNEQLALLGYYEADEVEKDYNEAYGYMRNAEKKAVKDASNLASQLIDDLGLDRFEATHREADKKGKRKTKPLAVANIAPAGGDVSMHLPLAEGRELYVNIQLVPSAGKGITNFGGDNLEVTGIMFRVNNPNGTGNDRYGRNEWVNNDVTYSELLDKVKREAYKYIPERTEVADGKYATGDKVQYSTDGGRTWTDAVVVQPNDEGGIRIDTGLAPVMWVNAHPDQLRHKPQAESQNEDIANNPQSWVGRTFVYDSGDTVLKCTDILGKYASFEDVKMHYNTTNEISKFKEMLKSGMFKVQDEKPTEPKNEDIFQKAERIAKEAKAEREKKAAEEADIMGTDLPEPAKEKAVKALHGSDSMTDNAALAEAKRRVTKKRTSKKKVKPEQQVGNLFAGLFDKPKEENGTENNDSSSPSKAVAGTERPDTVGIDETGTDGAERTTAVAGTDGERSTDASRENGREAADGAVHGTDEIRGIQPPVGNRGRDESTADGTVSNGATDERGRVAGPRTVQTGEIDGGGKELSSGEPASSTGEGGGPATVKKQRTPVRKFTNNFHYGTDGNEADNYTPGQRLEGNVSAIEVIAKLFKEGRNATDEEKQILSRFRGWGQIDQLSKFYSVDQMRRDTYGNSPYRRLANAIDTLDPDGKKGVFAGIKRAALSSYYTPTKIASAMNSFLSLAGFKGGTFLDPSMGNGIFEGTLPKDIQERTMITGVELDWLSGQISRALYPDADVRICGFEKSELTPNSQDVVTSNVPFGDIEVNDPTWKNDNSPVKRSAQKRIHNYYAVKMLELTRPGGIVAMMTSPAVMDTQSNQHIRRYIAEQGEFLGAVRLPDNTFQGTGAMADIIYIRKWKDEEDAQKTRENPDYAAREQAFLSSAETTAPNKRNGEKQKVSHNAYYASNRKNMIGDVVAGNQYNDKSFGLHSELTTDQIAKEVEKAVERIVGDRKGMLFDTTRTSREVKQAVREEYKGDGNWVSTGNLVIQDGKVGVLTATKNEYGEVTRVFEEQPQLAKQKKRIIAMGEVRTAMKELIAGQIDGLSDTKLNMLRAKLKRAYDEFVSKYGKLQDTDNAVVLNDIDGYTLQALEVWKGGKFQGLSDIFTKNTIKPALKLEDAKTPQEAITTSLAEYGEIRGEYIEKALGADWFEQCGDLVFKEPNATDRYVTRDEYLSGDVVAKLEEAKTAAATDPTFERNVKELEQVQPATIPFDDITIHLGARWIPQEVLNDFVKETLGLHASSSRNYEWVDGERREIIKSGVVYVPETDTFEINIEAKELGGQADDWKTADKSVKEIFQAALEDKDFRIVRKDKDGNTWIDQEATELANSKVADLREHFEQWLPGDDARVQTMERAYNDRFNRIVLRKWDGSHLNVPGLMGKELRPHQKDAVWMLINNRGGIVDHIVGAGKTLVMQSAIMEMRRMGIAKKPMIVALKSTVPQIAREFKEAYPTARVLAPSEKDFSTENRKKFFANISLNDYDCIIVSHEQYCKIPHSEEAEGDVVNEQLAQLDAMIEYLYGTGDKSQLTKRQIKSLEKRRQNLHAKLEKRLDRSTDREFCFENMGIDYLFVDECHRFKSLPYVTSYQNVAGLGEASGSDKAVALLTGIRHLQKMHQGDKGTVFLSGTTITNSLVEIYNLLNYLRPHKLEQLGMPTFDAWASTFAVHTSELEAGVSNEFKMKDRFRYFDNVPELSQLYAEIADVRNDYNLQLPKPKVDGKTVIVPQSDAVAEINREVVNMLQTKDGSYFGIHPEDPKKFPWGLVASGISAKAAVSPRLVFPEMDDSVGKISYCCDNIKKAYDEMKEQKGVQLVFCELGVPSKDKNEYDAYHDIIDRLTKDYGIPREEIAYIQQVKKDTDKEALFQKVRDGKVRILIGGTQNMGTGVNVQTRITDLHMLTVPWQPADLEQCIGRGSRQGNVVAHDFLNNKVRVHYYATEGSLDLYKYQLLDAKGKMFTQFKMGTISGERSFDEGDADENGNIDPAQMVALLSGNPIIFEKSKQDKLVKKLKSLYNGFLRDQQRKRQNYETVTKKVDNLKRLISLSDSDVHDLQREGFKPDEKGTYPSKVKVCVEGSYYGQDFDKPKEAGQYILEQLKNNKKVVLAGFGQRADVVFVTGDDLLSSHYEVQLGGNNAWSIRYTKRMPQDPTQAGLVFRSLLEQIIHNNEVYHREYDTNSEMLKTMPKGDAPFPKQKELDEAIAKQKELDAEYNKLGQSEEDKTKFRLLDEDDPKAMELESLPESELVPVYRNVQAFEDDALGSPMAFTDAETGERRTLEGRRWNYSAPPKVELTEEQQRKLDELNKNGYIMVDGKKSTELQINDGLKFVKPKTKEAQLQYFLKKNPEDKGLWAAYDPYDHAIETPLNTQFGEAYKRPNLVVVRSLIPKSEIDEPFHADYALLPTGAHQWNNGRTLYLSRWSKIDKVLTREEEAKLIDEYWKKHPGKREELKTHRDYNRFVPQVRRELEKMGYRFELDGKELTPEESLALDKQNWESRDVIPGREGHTPFVSNEDIARINAKMAGKWVGEPKEAMESAMSERVTELSERLHTPVRIIRTEEEVAALPSVRQRRMKGSFNPITGEVTIVVPNNANMADIENTFVHEVVGHDGLRVLFPDEAKLNNALDELYRVSKDEIRGTIDRMAQKMYDAEVDRIREKKRKEHVANGEDANASYYADMAAAHAEAGKKREQFKRDATEEYGADLAGRIGEKGFEKMSAEELTFWGKLKAMLQKALQKLLDGLKIPGKRKWGDKDWAFVLHEAYKRKKNGGKPTVFDAADTEVMRRKTGFGEMKFSDGKHEQNPQVATTIADMKQRVTELFEKAKTGEFVGKPASIGRLSVDGKAYLEKLSGLKFKEFVNFVLNPSDLNHIRSDHYGENEKDKGNNVPLTDEDIQNMVDVLNQPDGILYGVDKKDGRKLFFFLKDAGNGLYNLTEVCSTKKGNLTAKSFFKSKKKGISQRVMEIKDSLLPTSVTYSGEFLSSDAKIPTLFEINEGYSKNVADEGIMFRDGDSVEYNKAMARDIYEQRVSRGMYQMQEALQDSMLGLKEAMDAILKAEGNGKTYIEDVAGYENAYLGENRLSSVNQAECTAFAQTLFKPMLEEVAKLAKTADERAELTDYMMAKHGLERNEVMARRAAEKDARSEFFAEIIAAQQAVDNDPLDQDAIDALEDVKQRMQDREEELYLINRERDYAGLTALTGMDNVLDAETEAQQMVSDYERDHWVDGLWDKVNAVTKATLQKTYESGLINKATYDDISGMYGNYIPLRGFDDKTSDEAYAYLTDKHSAFNAPIKTAKGRKSKADDPFANMEAMAESAIMQGNRNTLVKQKFLNFALNHPSDLVSVSDLWLWHNDVADEWQPINSGDLQGTERIEEDDSPAEVERKMRDFEYAMQQAAKNDPAHFRKQKDNPAIPYRVVESRDLRQHQVLVKRNGRDIILTINGNPRAAQALNGQTNPDNDVSGAIGAIMRLGETINRQLSAFYTTRNPDFVVSNFMRDMMYANTMVWVKESPNYAWRFHKNVAKVNPAKMKVLLAKLRNGTLDLNDETEKMFHLFMMNGGETGYANIRDIEQRKNDIKRELKKSNGQMPIRKAWDLLGERLDEYNRAVENCARFAAFMTSRQLGRTIDRSVYDAKEISVNFNKKGSGAKFWKTNGQTGIGNVAAFTSGLGRSFYVFWNAALQGSTNFGRQFKRHPKKAIAGAAAMFLLGALMASIGGGDGDDDKDDKNDYFNLPEYVRRSNVVFRLPGMDKSWISMPLPVEYRAMYGMGELMVSAMNGKEHYTAGELAHQMASQVSQMLPIDIMEGSGGFKAFVPSAIKPIAEVIGNESWTGMPIYKDTPFNKDMPEWTKAYKSANKYLVGLSKALNEATGGDAYTSGKIDINPAQVEYLLNGIFGGVSSTIDRLTKMGETVIGDREYDPRSFLLLNRLVKNGDERTEYRAVNNEYFRIKEESEKLRTRLNHYENDTADGVFDYAEKIAWLNNSPEYRILETYEDYSGDIDDINEELKAAASDEERKGLEAELNEKKKELVDAVNNIRNGKQQ